MIGNYETRASARRKESTRAGIARPKLSPQDYALVQATVDGATRRIKDGPRAMIYIREAEDGLLFLVKATQSGEGLFVTSFRRISANPSDRARLVRQFERRGIE